MAISKDQLSRLSSAEISHLFHESRNLALQQKYGTGDTPASSRFHIAPDNSVCDCGNPASHYPPEERFYVSENGAMVRLEPGEERPASLEDQRTERLLRMTDAEVSRLSEDAQAELIDFREATIEARAQKFRELRPRYNPTEENKWEILTYLGNTHVGYVPDDEEEAMLILASRGLWTPERLCEAYDELNRQGKLTPLPGDSRQLDSDELRTLSAYCAGCNTDAEFERILDSYLYLATGARIGWRAAAMDSRYSGVLEESIFFCFENSTADYSPSSERRQFLRNHLAGRFPSIRMLRAGWELCKQAEAKGEIEDKHPAPESVLSEDEQKLQYAQQVANEIARASWEGV